MLGPREASPDVQDKEAEAAERPSQDPGFCQGQSSRGGGGVLARHEGLGEEWGSVCVTTRHACVHVEVRRHLGKLLSCRLSSRDGTWSSGEWREPLPAGPCSIPWRFPGDHSIAPQEAPNPKGGTLVSESTVGRGSWAGKCRYFPRSHTQWT